MLICQIVRITFLLSAVSTTAVAGLDLVISKNKLRGAAGPELVTIFRKFYKYKSIVLSVCFWLFFVDLSLLLMMKSSKIFRICHSRKISINCPPNMLEADTTILCFIQLLFLSYELKYL